MFFFSELLWKTEEPVSIIATISTTSLDLLFICSACDKKMVVQHLTSPPPSVRHSGPPAPPRRTGET